MSDTVPQDLKDFARFRIATEMINTIRKNSNTDSKYMPIVMDDTALSIFSSLFTLKDLPDMKISRIEKLTLKRKHMPYSEGIYLVDPTQESIEIIIKDFENPKKPQFSVAHICLLNKTPTSIFEKIANSSTIASHIATYLEINLQFSLFDTNTFYFSKHNTLKMFDPQKNNYAVIMDGIVDQLYTICCTTYEFPEIKYYNKSTHCAYIANKLNQRLTEFQELSKFSIHEPRGLLIILDRTIDMPSCMMHDYSMMSLIYDMNKRSQVHNFPLGDDSGELLLDYTNDIWEKVKYVHISKGLSDLSAMYDKFSSVKKKAESEKSNVNEVLKLMPEYQSVMKILPKMMKLAKNSTTKFNEKSIANMIKLEQTIITGMDEAKAIKKYARIASAFSQLKTDFSHITDEEITRLLVMFASQFDIPQKDIKTLMGLIQSETYRASFQLMLKYSLFKQNEECTKGNRKDGTLMKDEEFNVYEAKIAKQNQGKIIWSLPKIAQVILNACKNKYDELTGVNRQTDNTDERRRVIAFMIGGLSVAEIGFVNNLQKFNLLKQNIILGSNAIVTPCEFMESVVN